MAESHKCDRCEGDDPNCITCEGAGFDTRNTDTPVCPYCGHEMSTDDLYESATRTCDECDHDVEIEIEYTPSYSTIKGDKADVEYKTNKDGIASARRFMEAGKVPVAAYVIAQLPITRELGLEAQAWAIRDASGSLDGDMTPLIARIEEAWKAKEVKA